jgi:NAD(P)-dependent dehydrogenase (short-subunit alcohol dehydrogenase family)
MQDLSSKVALITGGSSGIGAEIARAMGAAGAEMVLVGRDRTRLDAVVSELRQAGAKAYGLVHDLTDDGAAETVVAETVVAAGEIDIVVHAAGLLETGPFRELGVGSMDRQYRTNVWAPYALTVATLPHLRENGAIVFISSVAAVRGFPEGAAYCASKGAVDALVRALAGELGPEGIRVNAIAPGEIDTPMNAPLYATDPDYLPTVIERTPARRVGTARDVAACALFLASDAASYIHGETLVVDGGFSVM